jgi:hypothetical protein
MRKLTNLGSALVVAVLVAGGMVTFSAPIEAAGPGGRSNEVLCALLANAEAAVSALPDSDFKTASLANIDARQEALGCDAQ